MLSNRQSVVVLPMGLKKMPLMTVWAASCVPSQDNMCRMTSQKWVGRAARYVMRRRHMSSSSWMSGVRRRCQCVQQRVSCSCVNTLALMGTAETILRSRPMSLLHEVRNAQHYYRGKWARFLAIFNSRELGNISICAMVSKIQPRTLFKVDQ
mmetsp:Transcript_9548/g.28659  ORF Transcript_9548/g.28659 Transcript_9548/m.28659 type:complete len:152 (+) Transcript_9548:311-766(+)